MWGSTFCSCQRTKSAKFSTCHWRMELSSASAHCTEQCLWPSDEGLNMWPQWAHLINLAILWTFCWTFLWNISLRYLHGHCLRMSTIVSHSQPGACSSGRFMWWRPLCPARMVTCSLVHVCKPLSPFESYRLDSGVTERNPSCPL